MTDDERVDVLRYETDDDPTFRAIEAGRGQVVVRAHEEEVRKRRLLRWATLGCLAVGALGYGFFVSQPVVGALAGLVVLVAARALGGDGGERMIPTLEDENVFRYDAERRYPLDDE